jgi:hypothetical protein
VHDDREWLIPMGIVTAIQFALWGLVWRMGFAEVPLVALYDVVALTGIGAALIPFFLAYLLRIGREGETRPLVRIRRDFDGARAGAVVIALILGSMSAGAFSALKSAIPFVVPFYLDPALASFERAVFGTDVWRISHALFGWATPALDRLYLLWLPVMLIAFNLIVLSRPSEFKTRSLVTYTLVWPLIGTFGACLCSSAGPIFHDALFGGNSGLLAALQNEGATGTLFAYHHLWGAYAHRYETLGGGISAMPSVHVAMACWLALSVRERFPKFQWLGWTYLGLIWFSSFHLGWHYLSGGIVAASATYFIWRAADGVAALCQVHPARRAAFAMSAAGATGSARGV